MDTKDKLVIRIPKPTPVTIPEGRRFLAVTGECWAKVNDISSQTGLTIGKLTAMMIDFAIDRLEVIEE